MSRLGVLGAAVLLGLAACQPTETPEQMQARMDQESAAFNTFVTGVARRWEAWYAAAQADSVASVFMEDGREMPPNGKAAVGRAAILAMNQQVFGLGKFTLGVHPEAATANGPLGVERGTYTTTFTPNAGISGMPLPAPADTGKYVAHWHQVNGTWQIAELIYNSDLPLPVPPPTRRR